MICTCEKKLYLSVAYLNVCNQLLLSLQCKLRHPVETVLTLWCQKLVNFFLTPIDLHVFLDMKKCTVHKYWLTALRTNRAEEKCESVY